MFENHNRFVAGTTLLHEFLIHLGFKLDGIETKDFGATHLRPHKTYILNNKVIKDSYNHVTLFTKIVGKLKQDYRGGTVPKDILIFFSQRQKEEVNNETSL